jgi:hypothetical protein
MLVRPPGTPLYNWLSASFPTVLIVAGTVVVVTVLLARAKAAKAPKIPSLEERFARLAAERGARAPENGTIRDAPPARHHPALRGPGSTPPSTASGDALDAVIRDTEELAQRLAAAMDARAARLETLIREADDRLRRLEAARFAQAAATAESQVFEPRHAEPARPPTALAGARALGPSFDAEPDDPVHRQVFTLADQGLPALDIARRLGQPTGQVELILALRGR